MFAFPYFSKRLISWHKNHGRHDLPWQKTRDPYRIWISEIMLQQTQVNTVIPYYQRFIKRFPDIQPLSRAREDSVLSLWSGLGYYSRARNLHHAAKIIQKELKGRFPRRLDAIASLPGIGRSTAAAISVIAFKQRNAILDGNVKRVLARFLGIKGFPGDKMVEEKLWRKAETLLPANHIRTYTQALMDLGALVCVRSNPACPDCPVRAKCYAFLHSMTARLPAGRKRKPLPVKKTIMLIFRRRDRILLYKRPPKGIWAGLWSLPEEKIAHEGIRLHPIKHTFTHFSLLIQPILIKERDGDLQNPEKDRKWVTIRRGLQMGLPKPVRGIIEELRF